MQFYSTFYDPEKEKSKHRKLKKGRLIMFEETMETTAVETTEATSIMGTVMKIAIPTVALLLGIGVGYTIEKYRTAKAEPKAEQQKTEDK